jgi:hypothetical protein
MMGQSAEFRAMSTVKVDEAKRIRLPVLNPGDYYEADYRGPEEIVLRRVGEPKGKAHMTHAEALEAIKRSPLRFTVSWDRLRVETR